MARLAESMAARGAEVRVLSLNPRKHRADASLAPLPAEAIDVDTSRIAGPLLRAAISRTPFVAARFVARPFASRLAETLHAFRPEIVQIESPFLLPYAPTVRRHSDARIVLRSLNVEFRIWDELAASEPSPLRRLALRRVADSLRRWETRALDDVDALVAISRDDANDFRALGFVRPLHVAPCGMPVDDEPIAGEHGAIGFLGALDYRPNQQAVLWILDELRPRIAARAPHARLTIGGSNPPSWLRARARIAAVPDARAFLRGQAVVIAPLLSGGGMRIKVLEAMSYGCAIVATTRGAGGIEAVSGHDIVIADDPDTFADAVVRLLDDRVERRRLGSAARATIRERYDSDRIARDVLAFYATLRA